MRDMGPINGNKRSSKGSKFVADLESAIMISGETRENTQEGDSKEEELEEEPVPLDVDHMEVPNPDGTEYDASLEPLLEMEY